MKSNSQLEADLIVEIIDIINKSSSKAKANLNHLIEQGEDAVGRGCTKLFDVCCVCCFDLSRVSDGGSAGGGGGSRRVCSLNTSQSCLIADLVLNVNIWGVAIFFCCCSWGLIKEKGKFFCGNPSIFKKFMA